MDQGKAKKHLKNESTMNYFFYTNFYNCIRRKVISLIKSIL